MADIASNLAGLDASNGPPQSGIAPPGGGAAGGDNSDLEGQIQQLQGEIDQAQQQLDALNAEWASLNGTGANTGPAGGYQPGTGGTTPGGGGNVSPGGQPGALPANYQLGSSMLFNNGDLRRFGFGGPPPQNMYPVGQSGNGLSTYQPPPMPGFTPPYRNSAQDAQPVQGPPNPLIPAP